MSFAARFPKWPEQARFVLLLVFLGVCCLWGGASRVDVPGMAVVKPAAVAFAMIGLLLPGQLRLTGIRTPLLLLVALAAVIAVQLVPLPPGVWMALPGHEPFAKAAALAGIEQPWRPISLAPDLTWASLTALAVPAAVLVLLAGIPAERTHSLLPYLIGIVVLSALAGAAQVAGGPESPFYLYEVTNSQSAVGLFSNRNHQAVLLVIGIPMLALWPSLSKGDSRFRLAFFWLTVAMAALLLPMLAITGSRGGIIMAPIGVGFGLLLLRRQLPSRAGPGQRSWLIRLLPLLVGLVLLVAAILLAQTEAMVRLLGTSVAEEPRGQYLPTMLRMMSDFFPVGSGFGSFDPVMRYYEPTALLAPEYMNHAHNDLLELAITGGLPALIVAAGFLAWVGPRVVRAVLDDGTSRGSGFAVLASAIIVFLLASSLLDYPLRTPLFSAVFAIACVWLAQYREGRERRVP